MSKFRKLPEEVRRRQILDAALAVFTRESYDKVSMERLAKAAGMTKGGVYFHFRSKEEVFTAMVEEELERRWQHLRELAVEVEELSPAVALQQVLTRWFGPGDRPDLVTPTVLATCIAMERPRDAFLRQNERVNELVATMVGRLLAELRVQVDPHDLAELLMMIRIGAIWKQATLPPEQRRPGSPPAVTGTLLGVIGALAAGGGAS